MTKATTAIVRVFMSLPVPVRTVGKRGGAVD